MLKQKIKQDDKTIISLDFNSVDELLNYIETTPVAKDYWTKLCSREQNSRRYAFTGTNSLEEAINLCRFSNNNECDKLFKNSEQFSLNCQNISNKRAGTLKQYGYRPNIARNMAGHPMQMYHLERDSSRKFINIFFDCAAGNIQTEEYFNNKGMITLNIIKMLEMLNYRVNLNFFLLSHEANEWLLIKINIKKFEEKIDPNICYFPMTHPSFLRRILFAVTETIKFEESTWAKYYGKPASISQAKDILNISDNDIFIDSKLGLTGDFNSDVQVFIKEINLSKYLDKNQEISFDSGAKQFILRKK